MADFRANMRTSVPSAWRAMDRRSLTLKPTILHRGTSDAVDTPSARGRIASNHQIGRLRPEKLSIVVLGAKVYPDSRDCLIGDQRML